MIKVGWVLVVLLLGVATASSSLIAKDAARAIDTLGQENTRAAIPSLKTAFKKEDIMRFASARSEEIGPLDLNLDGVPEVSVAFQCIIVLTVIYIIVCFLEIVVDARENAKFFSRALAKDNEDAPFDVEEKSEAMKKLHWAKEGLANAVRPVPMLAIIIIFSHYRCSIDLGFVGENTAGYPGSLENGFYIGTFFVLLESVFVITAIWLSLWGEAMGQLVKACAGIVQACLLIVNIGTAASIAYILHEILTVKAFVPTVPSS